MPVAPSLEQRNRKVAGIFILFAAAMLGLGYASVPLYRLFCQMTGFGGTPLRVSEADMARMSTSGGSIDIRFDANVARDLAWQFRPLQVTDTAQLGGRRQAVYLARNLSDKPVTGRASFNVEPALAAKYFNKVQCFCFTEQTLQPGQEVRMPVIYFVDPKIREDADTRDVGEITLSYTFHQAADQPAKPLDHSPTGG